MANQDQWQEGMESDSDDAETPREQQAPQSKQYEEGRTSLPSQSDDIRTLA